MKKTSAYGRRLKRQPEQRLNPALAWTVAITRSTSYEDGSPERAQQMLHSLRSAANRLANGETATEDTDDHDNLLRAFATASVRAEHIAGRDNPAETILSQGIRALNASHERFQSVGTWTLVAEEGSQVRDAIDAYETILMASSPLQMEKAFLQHLDELKAQLIRLQDLPTKRD